MRIFFFIIESLGKGMYILYKVRCTRTHTAGRKVLEKIKLQQEPVEGTCLLRVIKSGLNIFITHQLTSKTLFLFYLQSRVKQLGGFLPLQECSYSKVCNCEAQLLFTA